MNRTQKSIRNIIYAVGANLITTILAFVSRTVMVKTIGLEAISLNGLFTEVIAALSLAELGVGSAIVYSLYKPLAEKDEKKICQLMTLFRTVYRVISISTLVIGSLICPFVHRLIKDIGYPVNYIRIVYMLFVLQLSVSYLFTYRVSLLDADQNRHVYSKISTIVKCIGTVVMILLLRRTRNYILYLILNIITTMMINVVSSLYVDKYYPYLRIDNGLSSDEKKAIFSNVKNIFIKQLSGKITHSTDNILISILVSTIYVGYYSFYSLVFSTFKSLIDQIEMGIHHSLGDLFATDNNEKCRVVINRLTWLYGSVAVILCTCIYVCMKSFITLWVGVEYVLPHSILLILCINMFAYIACKPIYAAMHLSGFFVEGRNISIIGSTANLISSIILGVKLGMLGIFIGTFITYLIQIVLKIRDVYKLRFKVNCWENVKIWLLILVTLLLSMIITDYICQRILLGNPFIQFIANGVIGVGISSLTIIAMSWNREEYRYTVELIKHILRRE